MEHIDRTELERSRGFWTKDSCRQRGLDEAFRAESAEPGHSSLNEGFRAESTEPTRERRLSSGSQDSLGRRRRLSSESRGSAGSAASRAGEYQPSFGGSSPTRHPRHLRPARPSSSPSRPAVDRWHSRSSIGGRVLYCATRYICTSTMLLCEAACLRGQMQMESSSFLNLFHMGASFVDKAKARRPGHSSVCSSPLDPCSRHY
jgi:hypothetical protein